MSIFRRSVCFSLREKLHLVFFLALPLIRSESVPARKKDIRLQNSHLLIKE